MSEQQQDPKKQEQRGPVDPRAAVYRPGDLWVGVGKPLTGFGAVKVRLTPEYLIWETGTLRSDVQQVPLAQIFDVDAMQSMVQKSRGVGNVRVSVNRGSRMEYLVLQDLPDHRAGVDAINEHSRRARHNEQRMRNTQHVNYGQPLQTPQQQPQPPAAPVAPLPSANEIFGQLERLGALRDKGFITAEDFDAKKAELLGRL